MNVNGRLTMGENIGDLSGLTVAYEAYKLSLGGGEAPVIDGFTGDQRFFLGWAQVWRRLYRDAEMRNRLLTDSHSPSEYRTNGPLSHIEASTPRSRSSRGTRCGWRRRSGSRSGEPDSDRLSGRPGSAAADPGRSDVAERLPA